MQHRARKRFGQNFLRDPVVIRRIVDSIRPTRDQHLVEIGPGLGVITRDLLSRAGRLDVVELDRDLIPALRALDPTKERLIVHQADALKFQFCRLAAPGEKLRLVGNLPYNVSTPLLFHLLQQAHCIVDLHLMLQKEVVARMSAEPGGKTYGRLSVMLQLYCKVTPLFDIGPGAFHPVPKVESSFVRLRPYAAPRVPAEHRERFAGLVTQAFSHRRKTLRNSLRGLVTPDCMRHLGIDPGQRPERLSLDDFAALAGTCINASEPHLGAGSAKEGSDA